MSQENSPTVTPLAAVSLPVTHDNSGCESTPGSTCASHAVSASAPSSCGQPPVADEAAPVREVALLDALKTVIDPELMVNVVDLGLVYAVDVAETKVSVEMTLTSPACPAGPQIIQQSRMALERVPGVKDVEIRLVMSPPWSPERMTDEARDQLGIF